MTELRDLYDGDPVADRLIQPPFADLQRRARRRRNRNRVAMTSGVAALAALAVAPLLLAHGDGGRRDSPGAGWPSFPPVGNGLSYYVDFYDPQHGFASYHVGDVCGGLLSVTEDGGETWSELRELPPVSDVDSWDGGPGSCLEPRVIQIAEDTLVMPVTAETVPGYEWVDPPATSFISRDAGRTWREYEPQLRIAEAVPERAWLERHCEDEMCTQVRTGWYDPATGDRIVLDNEAPAATGAGPTEPMVAGDGSIWLAATGADGEYLVSVSRDRGRTWQTEAVVPAEPGNPTPPRGIGVAPTGGSTAYAAVRESAGARREVVLYRSTDHGTTWQPLAQPLPFDGVATMWGAPDGTLVLVDDTGAHHTSTDGGKTFAQVDLPVWDTAPIAGGFFAGALDDSATDPVSGYLSEDGVTWWPVRIPRP